MTCAHARPVKGGFECRVDDFAAVVTQPGPCGWWEPALGVYRKPAEPVDEVAP